MRLEEEKKYEDEDEDDDWKGDCNTNLTKEDRDALAEDERREREENKNKIKLEQKEKRQKKREMLKQASKKPMKPLPEMEICQYEKIREDNIRERNEAMAKFEFYEDLEKTKEEIGFPSKIKIKEKELNPEVE